MPKETRKAQATRLRFVGSPDHYVPGVAQGEVEIVADDAATDERHVTAARASELVSTRLYAPVDGDVTAPASQNDEAASAAEEVA